jgi:cell division protein FtsQ
MRALGFRLVRETGPVRRDHAPSRWAWRWQRAMLNPTFRRVVRVGLPVFALSLAVGLWATSDANRAAIAAQIAEIRLNIENRPEFQVTGLQVTGANLALTQAVTGLVTVPFPVSSFHLDLEGLRSDVVALSAVQDATVRVRSGGILEIAVTERLPVAVWRYTDGLRLVDAEGMMTGMIADRADRADLPLIAGDGAREAIAEALALFATAAPIADRVHGLVRMGERRWDLVLDREQRVLLPTDDPVPALQALLARDAAENLLARDISVIDLRNQARPTLRVNRAALNILRNTASVTDGGPATPADDNDQ